MDIPVYSVPLETSKRCNACNGLHSFQSFSKDVSKKDGRSIYCNFCRRRKLKEYRKSRPEKQKEYKRKHYNPEQSRDYSLRYRYGMTSEGFESMFDSQGRKCALCRSDKTDSKNFVVDHCHETGRIRGILCSSCNRALGIFKDSVVMLKKAIEYLGDF